MKPKDLAMMALFAALTAIGAQISIPTPPVPFTFQVLFVLLAGALLGSLRGGISMIVYMALGAVGLPVFASGGSGIGVLAGPTGGYIFGFVVAAFVVGAITAGGDGFGRNLAAMIVGVVIIYSLGLIQLMVVAQLGLVPALLAGVVKFVPFDLLKAAIAAALAQRLRPVVAQTA